MRHLARALIAAAAVAAFGCAGAGPTPVAVGASAAPGPRPSAAAPYAGPLPAFVAKPEAQALYRWAAPNRAILQHFPCTCGCEAEGHRSNWNCYVKAEGPNGTYDWDPMSVG